MLTLLTPNARSASAFSCETVAGFISIVNSSTPEKSIRSRKPPIRNFNCGVESAVGVPPPKKTVLGRKPSASNSASVRTASKKACVLFRSLASL